MQSRANGRTRVRPAVRIPAPLRASAVMPCAMLSGRDTTCSPSVNQRRWARWSTRAGIDSSVFPGAAARRFASRARVAGAGASWHDFRVDSRISVDRAPGATSFWIVRATGIRTRQPYPTRGMTGDIGPYRCRASCNPGSSAFRSEIRGARPIRPRQPAPYRRGPPAPVRRALGGGYRMVSAFRARGGTRTRVWRCCRVRCRGGVATDTHPAASRLR